MERQVTKGPISAGRQLASAFGFLPGPAGKRAPEEMSSLLRDAVPGFPGLLREVWGQASKAGRDRGHPKKGRGSRTALTEDFGPMAGRDGRKTSEPSGGAVD